MIEDLILWATCSTKANINRERISVNQMKIIVSLYWCGNFAVIVALSDGHQITKFDSNVSDEEIIEITKYLKR